MGLFRPAVGRPPARPTVYKPSFTPRYGIFLTPEELAAMREEHAKAVAETGTSPYAERVKAAAAIHARTRPSTSS